MKLQEILKESTPRPWGICNNNPELIVAVTDDIHNEDYLICDCGDNRAFLCRPRGIEAQANALLQKHAVNNFEPLLKAAMAMLPFIPSGDLLIKNKPEHAKAAQAFHEAVRQAKEVSDGRVS